MDPTHNTSDPAILAAENEELRDLCCYLDDDRLRLTQSVRKWKERYYQLASRSQCTYSGPIRTQCSSEMKETAKQLYDLKIQVERDLHHHTHQGSPDTQEAGSGAKEKCELILLDNLISVVWQELVQKLQSH